MRRNELDIDYYRKKYNIEPHSKLTSDDVRQIQMICEYDNTLSDRDIAEIYGCSRSKMQRFRVKHGIQNCNKQTIMQKSLTKEVLIELYVNQQMTDKEIAEKFNCREGIVNAYRNKYNIPTINRNLELHQRLTKEALIDMYVNKNMTDIDIAKELNCGTTVIYKHRMKYGIETIDRKAELHQKLTKENLYDMYINKQMSDDDMAREVNCDVTTIHRYRIKHNIIDINIQNELDIKLTYEYLYDMYVNKNMTDQQIADQVGCAACTIGVYRAKYGIETKNSTISAPQQEVYASICNMFIQANKEVPEILIGDKTVIAPFEIDIFIPEYNFGIEFNGSFWHSEAIHDKMYHYNKSMLAHDKGIFIYHIFSYEWDDETKHQQIKNQITNILGLNTTKIYARKCEIREVSTKEKSSFLDANHVQGNDRSSIKLGLYCNDELVSLMTFAKAKYNWKLSRFCSKAECNVVGGASKLFKYFVDQHMNIGENIVAYSDISKTKGSLYEILGFAFSHYSVPNYIWWKRDNDYKTQHQCQIKNEVQIMQDQKYYRVYDCGNKVWVYIKQ